MFIRFFFLAILIVQTQLKANNITIDGAAGIALVGQLYMLEIIEPSTGAEYKQFISDNAGEVNTYVMSLLDKYEYDSLPDRPFAITQVIMHTKANDPDGALKLLEKYRDYMIVARETKISKRAFPLELLDNPLSRKEDFDRLPPDLLSNMEKLQDLIICTSIKEKIQTAEEYLEKLRRETKDGAASVPEQSVHNIEHAINIVDKSDRHPETTPPDTPKSAGSLIYVILAMLALIVLIFRLMMRSKPKESG
jgi:hypothetical protein